MAKSSAKGLGKGLGALFSETTEVQEPQGSTLPIQKLEPNPHQPRHDFDEEALAELADSIAQHGLIQPITVRPVENGYYQIIAGERRWRASRMANLTEVPVNIIEADDKKAAQLALIENLQREDLNPLEEAKGYETLMNTYGLTQEASGIRGTSADGGPENSLSAALCAADGGPGETDDEAGAGGTPQGSPSGGLLQGVRTGADPASWTKSFDSRREKAGKI